MANSTGRTRAASLRRRNTTHFPGATRLLPQNALRCWIKPIIPASMSTALADCLLISSRSNERIADMLGAQKKKYNKTANIHSRWLVWCCFSYLRISISCCWEILLYAYRSNTSTLKVGSESIFNFLVRHFPNRNGRRPFATGRK